MSRRYELEPLLRAAGGISLKRLQQTVGFNGPTYRNVRDRGLTPNQADRYAVRLGLHPFEVWPEMAEHQIADAMRLCAATDCDSCFLPRDRHHRYCSPTCSSRHRRRLRYQRDPEYRDRRRADSAAYYAFARNYVVARERRSRQERKATGAERLPGSAEASRSDGGVAA